MDLTGRNVRSCKKLKFRQRKKTVMGSVSSVWFILFVWLNQTNRIKQSNQTKPVSPACLASLSFGVPNMQAIDVLLCQNRFSAHC